MVQAPECIVYTCTPKTLVQSDDCVICVLNQSNCVGLFCFLFVLLFNFSTLKTPKPYDV